jgi:putative ABC transport system permease protein
MIYDDTITGSDYDAMIAAIDAETEITEKMQIRISLMDASTDVATKQCYLLVTNSPDSIGDYITLRERVSQEPLTLGDDGVIITEKLSKMLEVSVGDTISVEVNDNEWVDCTVAGITENYATNYVYFSSDYYTSLVGTELYLQRVLVNLTNTDNATEDELSSMVADNDNI